MIYSSISYYNLTQLLYAMLKLTVMTSRVLTVYCSPRQNFSVLSTYSLLIVLRFHWLKNYNLSKNTVSSGCLDIFTIALGKNMGKELYWREGNDFMSHWNDITSADDESNC